MPVSNTVPVKVDTKVGKGLSTYFGYGFAVLAALGAIYAGIKGNDTATITAGASALLVAVQTGGGRQAQAVAAIRASGPQLLSASTALARDIPAVVGVFDKDAAKDVEGALDDAKPYVDAVAEGVKPPTVPAS